jgi:hypothetical protein
MKSADVIGAGTSSHPMHVSQPVVSGFSTGTWTTGTDLQPGDSYTVKVYAPNPSAAQLTAERSDYAGLSDGYRAILLPSNAVPGATASAQIVFPPFHSSAPVKNVIGLPVAAGTSLVESSVYAGAYRLARRLARSAKTPYGFVLAVERYLSRGYLYDQNPLVRPYPLASFLFGERRGYCQQFAGAMALLLRMGGVPARVAVGFTSGREDPNTGKWQVSDLDAHAWVEAWFPQIGWVKFDPTPAADPALAGIPAFGRLDAALGGSRSDASKRLNRGAGANGRAQGHGRGGGHGAAFPAEIAGPAAAVAVALLVALLITTRPLHSAEALVRELERALARSGRPLAVDATLAGLERRMGGSPQASAYIRALRLARFGGGHASPTPAQRRALRRELAFGLGPVARARAFWALPPRRRKHA